ncbi:MAG: hypothetical protein U9Q37_05235 [Euryarchaeota archaeon]|nr:hypothetical protein [Euryarchaeota archaeon]
MHTVFGLVVEGVDVVNKISKRCYGAGAGGLRGEKGVVTPEKASGTAPFYCPGIEQPGLQR